MYMTIKKTPKVTPDNLEGIQETSSKTALDLVRCSAKIVQYPPFHHQTYVDAHSNIIYPSDLNEIMITTTTNYSILRVNGVSGTVKIYNHKGKLILITTSQQQMAEFKIDHLKNGTYFLEANRTYFEFIK